MFPISLRTTRKRKKKERKESEREKRNGHTHHFSVLSHPRSIVYKNPGRHIDAKIIDDNVRRFKNQKKKKPKQNKTKQKTKTLQMWS